MLRATLLCFERVRLLRARHLSAKAHSRSPSGCGTITHGAEGRSPISTAACTSFHMSYPDDTDDCIQLQHNPCYCYYKSPCPQPQTEPPALREREPEYSSAGARAGGPGEAGDGTSERGFFVDGPRGKPALTFACEIKRDIRHIARISPRPCVYLHTGMG